MDLVRDFEGVFKSIENDPVKDVSKLVDVIKKHGTDPDDSSTWRWDVMRAVVYDDLDYVKLVTAAELQFCYAEQKIVLQEVPEVINVTAMLLHTHYKNFHNLVDVVSIQKAAFGPELFAVIEEKTVKFLDRHITKMMTEGNTGGDTQLEYATDYYKMYVDEFKDYYYLSQIKDIMDRVILNLS
jgi:hypothetical protein